MELDRLMGTNYFNNAKSDNIDVLQAKMAQYARRHCLGVLIIDEIQHLSLQGPGGRDKMMNFFVSLVNEIGISVILIGTNKAATILNKQFRMARRAIGIKGEYIWERLENDRNWQLLMEGMWDYQWTQKVIPFSKELTDYLYYESQGIVDIAIKLFGMAQLRAITTGIETVDKKMIEVVARDGLKLVKPMLDAYKSGRTSDLAKYEDLKPVNFNEFFEENKPRIDVFDLLKTKKKLDEEKTSESKKGIREGLVLKLLELKFEPAIVSKVTEEVLVDMEDKTSDLELMVQEALKRIFNPGVENKLSTVGNPIQIDKSKKTISNKKKKKEITIPELQSVLESTVEDGKGENMSAFDSLSKCGYIQLLLR